MWAGYLALANEQYLLNGATTTLGFINPALYGIGGSSSYDADFHDITSGGNTDGTSVGYDLSTGWGSPKGDALVIALSKASFVLEADPKTVTVAQGATGKSTITSTPLGGFNSTVTLSASGEPTGVTVSLSPSTITGGSGNSTLEIKVSATAVVGTYKITVKGTAGAKTSKTVVTLKVKT